MPAFSSQYFVVSGVLSPQCLMERETMVLEYIMPEKIRLTQENKEDEVNRVAEYC
jgi:hypothetical protein